MTDFDSQSMDVVTDEIPEVGKEEVPSDKMMDIDDDDGITTNVTVAEEEEARQAIEMLRGDDMSARVAAASKLENVAAALGEERTRKVSIQRFNILQSPHEHIYNLHCLAFFFSLRNFCHF